MKLSEQNMCQGTGNYFSMFWCQEMPCWGCQGCAWDLFLKFWKSLGREVQ